MSANYFWKNGEVVVIPERLGYTSVSSKYWNLFCVDTYRNEEDMRYGAFVERVGWTPIRLKDFPSEFRMHLLLLGVS